MELVWIAAPTVHFFACRSLMVEYLHLHIDIILGTCHDSGLSVLCDCDLQISDGRVPYLAALTRLKALDMQVSAS
jgi:hypothetical protein